MTDVLNRSEILNSIQSTYPFPERQNTEDSDAGRALTYEGQEDERQVSVQSESYCSKVFTADPLQCEDNQSSSTRHHREIKESSDIPTRDQRTQQSFRSIPPPSQNSNFDVAKFSDSLIPQMQDFKDSFIESKKATLTSYDQDGCDSDDSLLGKQSEVANISRQARKFQKREFDPETNTDKMRVEMIKDLNSQILKMDYSYLYKRQEVLDRQIRRVTRNWQFNKIIYEPYIQRLMDLIKIKIQYVSESKLIYERIYFLVEYLKKLLDYQGSRRSMKFQEKVADSLYQHFIQELQQKLSKNGVYYVRNNLNSDTRISLNQYIAKYPEFMENHWREILFLTANHVNQRDNKELPKPFRIELKKQCNAYDCLGCAKFFNINENVYYPEKLKGFLALGGSCMRMEANRASVLQEICGLLNGGGGVLLFNTEKNYNTVLTRGEYVTQIQKQEIEQRLNTLLNFIYPKPKPTNIMLTWVPMADPNQPSDQRYPHCFVEGLYVARVVVKPTEGHITHYWIQEGAPIFSVREKSIQPSGKRIIKGKDVLKFIKQKFNRFEAECRQDESLDKQLIKNQMTIVHTCCQPHIGRQISQARVEIEREDGNEHEKFAYASIVVAKKSDHETIRANLKKYNIECVIRTPFQKLKLRGAANSSVLYHNTRFDELLGVVSYNKEFQFGGRYLLVILITPYIRLIDRTKDNQMNENDLKSLGVWLNREYPRETLSLWQFSNENDELQYYISTCSRESSLYIYIVLTQFQEKSSFKNPKGLERLNQEERRKRFKKIYSTGNS